MYEQEQKRVCSWDYNHSSDPKKIRLSNSESLPLDDRQRLGHGPGPQRVRNNQYVAETCEGKMETSAFNNSYVQRMQQVQPAFSDKAGTSQMTPYKETNTISRKIPNSQDSFSLDKSIPGQKMLPRQSDWLQKAEGLFKTSEPSHQRQSVASFKLKQDDNSSQGGFSGFSQGNFNAGALLFDVHKSRGSSSDTQMQPFQLNTTGKYDKESSHRVDNLGNKGNSECLDSEASKRCDSQYDKHSSQWNNPSSQPNSQHRQSYRESDNLYGKKPPEWNLEQILHYEDSYKRFMSLYGGPPLTLNVDPINQPDSQYKASCTQGSDDPTSWQSLQYRDNAKKYGSQYSENHLAQIDGPQNQSSQYSVIYKKGDTGYGERLPDGNALRSSHQGSQCGVNYKKSDIGYVEKLPGWNDLRSSHQGSQCGVSYKKGDTGYGEKLPDWKDLPSSHQSLQYGVKYKKGDNGYGEKLPGWNDLPSSQQSSQCGVSFKKGDTGYGEKLPDWKDLPSSHQSLQYGVSYKKDDTGYGEKLPDWKDLPSSHQSLQYGVSYKKGDNGYGEKLPDWKDLPSSHQGSQYGVNYKKSDIGYVEKLPGSNDLRNSHQGSQYEDGQQKYHNQHSEKPSEWNDNPFVHQRSRPGDSCKKYGSQKREFKAASHIQNVVRCTPEKSYEKPRIQSGVTFENRKKISPSSKSSNISSQSISKIGDSLGLAKFANRNKATKTQNVQDPLEKARPRTVETSVLHHAKHTVDKSVTKLDEPGTTDSEDLGSASKAHDQDKYHWFRKDANTNVTQGLNPKSITKINHLETLQEPVWSPYKFTKNSDKQSGISSAKLLISEKIRKLSSFLQTYPDRINPASTLNVALDVSKIPITLEYVTDLLYLKGSIWTSCVRLGGVVIFRTFGNSKKSLKQYTYGEALKILRTKSVDEILSCNDVGSEAIKNEFRQVLDTKYCPITALSKVAGPELARQLLIADKKILNEEKFDSIQDPNDPFEILQSCARSKKTHSATPSRLEVNKLITLAGCPLTSSHKKRFLYQEKKPQLFYRDIYFLNDIPIGLGENVLKFESAKQCFQMALKNILEMPCEKLKAGISIEDNRKLVEVPPQENRKLSLCEKFDRLIQFAKLTTFTNDGLVNNIDKVLQVIPFRASVLFKHSEELNKIVCDFYLNDTYIASGQDSDRRISQQKAYKAAWTTLGSSQASDLLDNKQLQREETESVGVQYVHKRGKKVPEAVKVFSENKSTVTPLIIFETTKLSKKRKECSFSIIKNSASMCGMKFNWTCERNPSGQTGAQNNYIAKIFLDDELIATDCGKNKEKAKNNVGLAVWQKVSETQPVIQIVSDVESDAGNWITYEEILKKSKENVKGRKEFPGVMRKSTQVILNLIDDLAEKQTITQLIIAPDMPKSEKHEIFLFMKNMPYLQLETRFSKSGPYTAISWKSLPVPFILAALKDSSNIRSARYRFAPYSVLSTEVEMDDNLTESRNIIEIKSNSESEMDASEGPESGSEGIIFSNMESVSKDRCLPEFKPESKGCSPTKSNLEIMSTDSESQRLKLVLDSKDKVSTAHKSDLCSHETGSARNTSISKSEDCASASHNSHSNLLNEKDECKTVYQCNNQQKLENHEPVGEANSDLIDEKVLNEGEVDLSGSENNSVTITGGKNLKNGHMKTTKSRSDSTDNIGPRSKSSSRKSNSTGLKSHSTSRVGSSDRYKSHTGSRDSNLRESSSSRHKSGSMSKRESTSLKSDKGRSSDRYRSYARSRHSNSREGSSSRHRSGSAAKSDSTRSKSDKVSSSSRYKSYSRSRHSNSRENTSSRHKSGSVAKSYSTSLKSDKAGSSYRYKSDTRSRDSGSHKLRSHPHSGSRKPQKRQSPNTVTYIPDPKLIEHEENGTIAATSDIKHESDSQQESEDDNPATQSDSDLSGRDDLREHEGDILSEDDVDSMSDFIVLDDI